MTFALRLIALGCIASVPIVADTAEQVQVVHDPLPDLPASTPAWVTNALVKDSVDTDLTKLDSIVHLTPAQGLTAGEIFARRLQERTAQGGASTLAARRASAQASEKAAIAIEALLTPQQRLVYNSTPMMSGGQSPFSSTVDRLGYLDSGVQLTPDQMKSIGAILENEVHTVAAMAYEERATALGAVERATISQIKSALTEDQVTKLILGGNVIEKSLPLRILVGERIQDSKLLEALLGPITSVKPRGLRGSFGSNGQFTEATLRYEVTGSNASKVLTFRLVGDDLGRPTITKVTDSQGADVTL